jgi:hypothetical protein
MEGDVSDSRQLVLEYEIYLLHWEHCEPKAKQGKYTLKGKSRYSQEN